MTHPLPGPAQAIEATVEVPTSKSLTNRALIAAAAAGGGRILQPLDCEDTRLLAAALAQAGWAVSWRDAIEIGGRTATDDARVDLGNSGTGSRLILGLLACVPGRAIVDGSPRLRERPMQPLVDALERLGAPIESRQGYLPIRIDGTLLKGGRLQIHPGVSSQFVSSLLLAAPLMADGLELDVEGPIPSSPYLDLTRDVLETFGARVEASSHARWKVASGGLRQTTYEVEGDWSAAAFATAAVAVVGGRVRVGPLRSDSAQGDRALAEFLARAGLDVRFAGGELEVAGRATRPFEVDLTDTPDLFPALAVVAAAGPSGSIFTGLDHLKHKESDRLAVMIDNLGRLGAEIEQRDDSIVFVRAIDSDGSGSVSVTAAADHRIAMAMAVAGVVRGGIEIDDVDCVGKSFPGFWAMWEGLLKGADSAS